MRRRLRRTSLLAVLAVAVLGLSQGSHTTYEPPFTIGPSGGDQANVIQAEEDGRVTVARAYPRPGGIDCPGRAGYARLEVTHAAAQPVEAVDVAFTEAAVDPYTFIIVDVRTADGTYLGSRQVRGVVTGDGSLTVPVQWPAELDERAEAPELKIQFGLQLSAACPSADAGTLRFTAVTVHDRTSG